ncbi:MAG: response regulator [Anaerolineales bacterium]|nr:response regulator [Anaerolineales bacterium]
MSSNGRILVVEDDFDIANMLRIYFTGQGYSVEVAPRGSDALTMCRRQLPDLIVLDIMLPDMDGYAVCRELRTTTRTKHIPIIFLTQKDERSDRIAGLELGADDYITKPFDIEELKLRVRRAIMTYKHTNQTNPTTGLPSGKLIEEELLQLMRTGEDWALALIGIDHMQPFNENYGFLAGDEVLRFTSMLINRVIDDLGTMNDFVGHASNDTFVIITLAKDAHALAEKLRQRFSSEIPTHYNFIDAEQGGIRLADGTLAPLMSLSMGVVSSRTQTFSDIREITETAAELRRQDQEKKSNTVNS